jgi:outer membrane autotransporter protein
VHVSENASTASFSTSLVQMAYAAADEKRRKLAGGEENLQRLGINPATLVTPNVFDFDIWLQGRVVTFDDGSGDGEEDGRFSVVYLGMDYVVTSNLLVGALVQYDHMEQRSDDLATDVEGRGWMVGPYATLRLTDSVFFQSRAAWGRSSNDISPFLTYTDQFDTERWLAEGSLQGRWKIGAWSFRPQASVAYIEETQEAYVDSLQVYIPEQTVALGQARAGPEVSYLFTSPSGGSIQPYVSLEAIWNFDSSGTSLLAGTLASEEDVRGKVELGFRAMTIEGIRLDLSGSYDGIGADDYHAVSGSGHLNIPFN